MLLLVVLCGSTGARSEELYGLVVGIDDYAGAGKDHPGAAGDLAGAVRDAADIAAALHRAHAAEVVSLTGAKASKAAVSAAWTQLLGKAKRGDSLVFSFAGKGIAARAGAPSAYLLAGFDPTGQGREEAITRQELLHWFKAADDKGVKAVFAGDASFSGGLARRYPQDLMRLRQWPDESPAKTSPSTQPGDLSENDFSYCSFAYGAAEGSAVPEIGIDGEARGALSFALARAIEGSADKNGDGQVDDQELAAFLPLSVQALTQDQQSPEFLPHRSSANVLFDVPQSGPSAAKAKGDSNSLRLAVIGEAAVAGSFPHVTIVADPAAADIIWSIQDGTVTNRIGGVAAEKIDAKAIGPLLAKWTALQWLERRSALSPAPVKLVSGNQRYASGDLVQIEIRPGRYSHLTLFDLDAQGQVSLLLPESSADAAKDWSRDQIHQMFTVGPAAEGALHRVAIFSEAPLTGLQQRLLAVQKAAGAGLGDALEAALPPGSAAEIGILPIYMGSGG